MQTSTFIAKDIAMIYEAFLDTQAIFAGENIDVFYEDDYDIEGVSDRTIKVQSADVMGIVEGATLQMDSVTYTVVNFSITNDALETIIMLNKVES